MLSLFRLVLKYLEAALEWGCTRGWFNKTNHNFQLVHQFSGVLARQTWGPILFQQVPQVILFEIIPPCSEGCSREGVANRCFHTLPQVPSGQQSDAEHSCGILSRMASVPANGCLAFVPSCGPCARCTQPSQCSDAKTSLLQPPKQICKHCRVSSSWVIPNELYVHSPYCLKAFYEAVHPGEHCCPAIHHSFLLPH